jgi:hypothetical protein
MSIHYLKHAEIDTRAWDNCIARSFNGSLHACSWYLDVICERWDALVEDQYRSVMPLVIKRHWGQEIIDLPLLSHELGIFSGEPINEAKTQNFIESIPLQFRYFRILLNKFNPLESNYIPIILRNKYELVLIKPYHRLAENFSPELRSKLNLAMTRRFSLIRGLTIQNVIHFITVHSIPVKRALSDYNFRLLRKFLAEIIRYKSGELFGIIDEQHQLASVALFSWFVNRLTLQFQFTAADQVQDFPHLFLIDRFIEKYAETNSTLSFECPPDHNAPEKYTGFAAHESYLTEITRNNLPLYLKLFPIS